MKKFFKRILAVAAGLALFGSAAFADILTEKEDFYDDWIEGTWEFIAELDQGEGLETVVAIVEITGCDEDAVVVLSNEDSESEVMSLSDYLDTLFVIQASAGMTSDEFESYKPIFEAMGFELFGDLDWHINDDYDQITFAFGMDLGEAAVSVSLEFNKIE